MGPPGPVWPLAHEALVPCARAKAGPGPKPGPGHKPGPGPKRGPEPKLGLGPSRALQS